MRAIPIFVTGALLAACTDPAEPVTQPGASVFTPAVETLVLVNQGGGFRPPPPPGPCDPDAATYTITVATRDLAWDACVVVGSGDAATTAARTGHRALGVGEWTALRPQLDALVVVANDGQCSEDTPILSLTVTTSIATQAYASSFDACRHHSDPIVDSDALTSALAAVGTLSNQ